MSALQTVSSAGHLASHRDAHRGDSAASHSVHQTFIHPLYSLNPALFSAAAAAACSGLRNAAVINNGGEPHGKNNVKSFTIDAILGTVSGETNDRQNDYVAPFTSDCDSWREELPSELPSTQRTFLGSALGSTRALSRYRAASHITHPYTFNVTNNSGITFKRIQHGHTVEKCDKQNSSLSLTQDWKGSKNKRVRTIFTPEQLDRLEAEFERQQYMVGTERYYLAASLNLTEAQVKVWFQNRRIKWRKTHLEEQQAKLANRMDIYTDSDSDPEDNPADLHGNHVTSVDDVTDHKSVVMATKNEHYMSNNNPCIPLPGMYSITPTRDNQYVSDVQCPEGTPPAHEEQET